MNKEGIFNRMKMFFADWVFQQKLLKERDDFCVFPMSLSRYPMKLRLF